jgi:membrane associated rhomboid family serine protease
VQAAVGSHCLDCAKASRPAPGFKAKSWNARQLTLVANVLIAVNVAVFALVTLADPKSLTGRGGISTLQYELGLNKLLLAQTDEWYRLVTSGFLHFGVLHIAFNMLLLYQLGQLLERSLGRLRFGLLYGASLLAGSFGVLLLTGNRLAITGGASGAVFGLMAAAAIGLHRQGVNIFSTGLGTTLVLNLVLTFAVPGISIGGHLGGAIGGAICGWFMLAPRWKPTPRTVAVVVPVVVAVVSVIGSVIVVSLV